VSIFDRISAAADSLAHSWNAFINTPAKSRQRSGLGSFMSGGPNPSQNRLSVTSDRSIITSIYTRIAIDTAAVTINHVYLDENHRYLRDANSGLNNCMNLQANIDQGGRAFRQDIASSLLDKGYIAIVPIDTSDDPLPSGSYDIYTMRVGEIVAWSPRFVRVRLYNDITGNKEELWLPKNVVAIVHNPLYAVMNEPNGTYQRLLRKLNLLDAVDEAASSGKLDIIIQLPYVVRDKMREEQAEQRARDIESQLKTSRYGVAYTDGAEKITQLNRPAENNMLAQVQFLTGMLYSQLGLTEAVFDGTADQKTMLNYYNRTIEPILGAIAEAMKRTFLTKTARTQGQSIEYYRDPFKLLTLDDMGSIVDKLSRNEILTGNELRALLGYKPSADPNADKLLNKNLPVQAQSADAPSQQMTATPVRPEAKPLAIESSNNRVLADVPISSLST
jgi:hypothetical protein